MANSLSNRMEIDTRRDWTFIILILYIFMGWVLKHTTILNIGTLEYVMFLGLFLLFLLKNLDRREYCSNIEKVVVLWIPYYCYTAIQYVLDSSFQFAFLWLTALLVMLLSSKLDVRGRIPYKLIICIGLFACVGIIVQIFFPGFYSSSVSPLFTDQDIMEGWALKEYGFSGFFYQLVAAAEVLVCAELVVLYQWKNIYAKSRKFWPIVIAGIFVIFTFLTGKRTNSALSLLVPILVYYISGKKSFKYYFFLFCVFVIVIGLWNLLVDNIATLESSLIFRRAAKSYLSFQIDEDITSGRVEFWRSAIQMFYESPIFGKGPGYFRATSGFSTDIHNIYIQCLCEQGVLGAVFFISPLIYCLIDTIKVIKLSVGNSQYSYLLLSLALQLSYILEGLSENMNVNLAGYFIYAIAIAILASCKISLRQSKFN